MRAVNVKSGSSDLGGEFPAGGETDFMMFKSLMAVFRNQVSVVLALKRGWTSVPSLPAHPGGCCCFMFPHSGMARSLQSHLTQDYRVMCSIAGKVPAG